MTIYNSPSTLPLLEALWPVSNFRLVLIHFYCLGTARGPWVIISRTDPIGLDLMICPASSYNVRCGQHFPFRFTLLSLLGLLHSLYFDVTVTFPIIDTSSGVSRFHRCFSSVYLLIFLMFCPINTFQFLKLPRFLYMSPCPNILSA